MLGTNGIANIIAALIVAAAIIWTGGFGDRSGNAPNDDDYAEWLTRAVGDIRNDIVVNCGCCGDGESAPRRAADRSF